VKYPVKPVVLPADLVGIKAGKLPDYLLKPVRPYGRLHWLAAQAYHAMRTAARQDGILGMKPTSYWDTYRTIDVQERAFLARYTKAPLHDTKSIRMYKGEKYYLKPGLAILAVPGTGFHPLGLAVDISEASGKRLEWLLANADWFGFSWELQSEPWHLRYYVGDRVPLKVQHWLRSHADRDNNRAD
jgi:LAS superfamily LD-carboxypeptidase LdcB